MHTPVLFADLLIIFLVSVPVAFLCLRLKLPLLVGVFLTVVRERFSDTREPFVEHRLRAGIQGRKRTDDACLALCQNEIRSRDDEHRRTDDGQAQCVVEHCWQSHRELP